MNAGSIAPFEFTLTCETSDPYDASIRLLNDAQRCGAELVSLSYDASQGLLILTIRVLHEIDPRNLADRLGRHRSVRPLSAREQTGRDERAAKIERVPPLPREAHR